MGRNTNKAPESVSNFSASKIMVSTLLSTTCRIFLPALGLFGVGAGIDFGFGTKPYGMLIGAGVGIIVAVVLVALQLRSIKKEGK